jgi:hypothetical protein
MKLYIAAVLAFGSCEAWDRSILLQRLEIPPYNLGPSIPPQFHPERYSAPRQEAGGNELDNANSGYSCNVSRCRKVGRHATIECIQRSEEAVSTIGVISGLYIHEMRT